MGPGWAEPPHHAPSPTPCGGRLPTGHTKLPSLQAVRLSRFCRGRLSWNSPPGFIVILKESPPLLIAGLLLRARGDARLRVPSPRPSPRTTSFAPPPTVSSSADSPPVDSSPSLRTPPGNWRSLWRHRQPEDEAPAPGSPESGISQEMSLSSAPQAQLSQDAPSTPPPTHTLDPWVRTWDTDSTPGLGWGWAGEGLRGWNGGLQWLSPD